MVKKLLFLMLCMAVVSGCSINGYNMTYDYTERDLAWNSFKSRMEAKYELGEWYGEISGKEKKELRKLTKIKPEKRVTEHNKLSGFGAQGVKFTNGAEMERRDQIRIPDVTLPSGTL